MPPPNGTGSLETEIQSAISSGILNGAIILATDSSSSFTYSRALGTRTLLSGETVPQSLDDVLYLASATKLLASLAALQCVEDGLLTLTSDLSTVVPELTSKPIFKGWTDAESSPPVANLEPQTSSSNGITLKSLLTHTSGMTYDFFDPTGLAKWNSIFNPVEKSPADGTTPIPRPVEKAFAYPLAFQPNTSWMYGPSLDWAGLIVERLTGRRLGDHIRERIIAATGGNPADAEFYPPKSESLRSRLIDLHPDDPLATGKQVLAGGGNMNLLADGDFGGHGMFTTAQNYLRVLRSLLANDGKLLRPETVDLLFQDHLSEKGREGHQAALKSPFGPFFAVGTDEFDVQVGHAGGGLVTREGVDGWYGKGTMTWGGGLTLVWFVDRENDLCAIGALQAKLPVVEMDKIADLKQVFRRDIYRIREAWKKRGETTEGGKKEGDREN